MTTKQVNYTKKPTPGQCRAMRCSQPGTMGLITSEDDEGAMLCPKHFAQANAYAHANPTEPEDEPETVQDPNAPLIDTGPDGPIYSLDGGHHWFEGEPPTAPPAEPEPSARREYEAAPTPSVADIVDPGPRGPVPPTPPNPLATLSDTFASSSKVLAESPVIAELPALATYYGSLAEGADDFTISTQEELTAVGAAATKLATDLSRVDTTRTDITKPINAFKRGVDAAFAGALAPMKKVDAAFRREMRAYNNAQLAAAPALMAEGKHEEALAVAPPVMAEGISAAVTWSWELTDPSLVPAEFLTVDTAKVAAQVRLLKGQCAIPGIRVYPDTQIRVAKS